MKAGLPDGPKLSFFSALLFSATIFFFIPASVYRVNVLDISVSPLRSASAALLLTMASTLVLFFLISLLRGKTLAVCVSLLVCVSCFIWIKGNFLVWNYGPWDGKPVDWSRYGARGAIDLCLLAVMVLAAVAGYRSIARNSFRVAALLIFFQTVAFFGAYAGFPSWPDFYIDLGMAPHFSSQKNFILVVIDSFRGKLFQDLVENNADYRRAFDGFTYFPGAVADSSSTWLSLPAIFSARNYRGDEDIETFCRKTYYSYSLPLALKRAGYRVEMYNCPSQALYCNRQLCDNARENSRVLIADLEELRVLYLAAFFRASPQPLKKLIYERLLPVKLSGSLPRLPPKPEKGGHKPGLDPAIYFLQDINSGADTALDVPVFKFIYLDGPHPPFLYDADFNFRYSSAGEYDCVGYSRQAEAWLKLVCRMLDKLKSIGAYDNSLIMVVSDHGSEVRGDCFRGSQLRISQRSDCLISIKPFGSRAPLKASDAQASLSDLARTAMESLGLAHSFPGENLFGPVPERTRIFLQTGKRYVDILRRSYFPELIAYRVRGNADSPDSWDSPGRARPKPFWFFQDRKNGR